MSDPKFANRMVACLKDLLVGNTNESLEYLCSQLNTIGETLDKTNKEELDEIFAFIKYIVHKTPCEVSSEIKLMLQDILDLRLNNWMLMKLDLSSKKVKHIGSATADESNKEYKKTATDDLSSLGNYTTAELREVKIDDNETKLEADTKSKISISTATDLFPGLFATLTRKNNLLYTREFLLAVRTHENCLKKPSDIFEGILKKDLNKLVYKKTRYGDVFTSYPSESFSSLSVRFKNFQLDNISKEKETSLVELYKTFGKILDQLKPENFSAIKLQVNNLNIYSTERVQCAIDLIFVRVPISELTYGSLYAAICRTLGLMQMRSNSEMKGVENYGWFKTFLANKSEMEIEKIVDNIKLLTYKLDEIRGCNNPIAKEKLQAVLKKNESLIRKQSIAMICFIGELFKQKIISLKVIGVCLDQLLQIKNELSLELLCTLWTIIGQMLELIKNVYLDRIYAGIKDIVEEQPSEISTAIILKLRDISNCKEDKQEIVMKFDDIKSDSNNDEGLISKQSNSTSDKDLCEENKFGATIKNKDDSPSAEFIATQTLQPLFSVNELAAIYQSRKIKHSEAGYELVVAEEPENYLTNREDLITSQENDKTSGTLSVTDHVEVIKIENELPEDCKINLTETNKEDMEDSTSNDSKEGITDNSPVEKDIATTSNLKQEDNEAEEVLVNTSIILIENNPLDNEDTISYDSKEEIKNISLVVKDIATSSNFKHEDNKTSEALLNTSIISTENNKQDNEDILYDSKEEITDILITNNDGMLISNLEQNIKLKKTLAPVSWQEGQRTRDRPSHLNEIQGDPLFYSQQPYQFPPAFNSLAPVPGFIAPNTVYYNNARHPSPLPSSGYQMRGMIPRPQYYPSHIRSSYPPFEFIEFIEMNEIGPMRPRPQHSPPFRSPQPSPDHHNASSVNSSFQKVSSVKPESSDGKDNSNTKKNQENNSVQQVTSKNSKSENTSDDIFTLMKELNELKQMLNIKELVGVVRKLKEDLRKSTNPMEKLELLLLASEHFNTSTE